VEYEFDTFPSHLELYSNSPLEAQAEDDVANSGVFSNNKANIHAGDGVFATNFALPGYAQRENLLGGSEVIDRQTGTPIEVYAAGSTSAQQYMPSTSPRYPWPDRDGYLGGAVNKARMDDRNTYPTIDISDMPADFLGPVDGSAKITNAEAGDGRWRDDSFRRVQRGEIRALSGFMDETPTWAKVAAALAAGVAAGLLLKKVMA